MRATTLGMAMMVILAATLLYVTMLKRDESHVAALVPHDFHFAVTYSSINDLRQLYEGPFARKDFDTAGRRIGDRINAPGLDGISVQQPVVSYFSGDLPNIDEVLVVPTTDFGAYEDAFESVRENVTLKAPYRSAKNYFSVSSSSLEAKPGPDNELILKTLGYPVCLVGRPTKPVLAQLMFRFLFAQEARRQPQGLPLLANMVLPREPARVISEECEDLLLGIPQMPPEKNLLRGELAASLKPGGHLARAAPLARQIDLGALFGRLPPNTLLAAGAVLDGEAWKRLGLPLPLGAGAFLFAVVRPVQGVPRPYHLLVVARPLHEEDLAPLRTEGYRALLDEGGEAKFETSVFSEAEVATAQLDAPPEWIADLVRAGNRAPPPVYLAHAAARGAWYAAIGSHAELVLRRALQETPELNLASAQPLAHHKELTAAGHSAVALATPDGLKALRLPMPLVELGSFGQPTSVTATLDVAENRATGEFRLAR